MPPQLVALSEGPDILLDKPILLIGRHQECDIQIASRKISRRHCCIAQVHDRLLVRDLFSTNGIRINGVRVSDGVLKAGDELTIGNFRYQVKLNGDLPAAAPAPLRTEKSPPPQLVPEDQLDSCEDPVAIDDPAALAVPVALPVRPPGPPSPVKPLIPDNLELAHSSGELRPGV